MAVRIYESSLPTPFLPQQGLFDYIFPSRPGVSPLPQPADDTKIYIDAITGRTVLRSQLRDFSHRMAGGLKAAGVERGETVCIWGMNSIEWALTAFGCMCAGLVTSPASASYAAHELAHQMNDSGSTVIFLNHELLPTFRNAQKHLKVTIPDERIFLLSETPIEGPNRTVHQLAEAKPVEAEHFEYSLAQETSWLCYSSGTTGMPKGVMSSHYNLTSQMNASPAFYPKLQPGKDAILGFLPLSHVYGLAAIVLYPALFGVPVVLMPRFDEIGMLEAIQKYKITHALMVPPIVLLLVHSQNVKNYDLSTLRTMQSGAAPLSASLQKTFAQKFPHVLVSQSYGMTETSPGVLMCSPEDAAAGHMGVGRLLPTFQARLVREDGTDAPEGDRGELWVRGPSVMKGYHNNAEATAKTMEIGGWLKTGDVCTVSQDGLWFVVDRVKELIKYKGFQVAPAELEALLLQHPKVVDAGVVGVWDESQATELPRAYLVPAPGIDTRGDKGKKFAADVQAWVNGRLAGQKHVRGGTILIDAIPKSPSGKILRNQLRKAAQEEFAKSEKAKL